MLTNKELRRIESNLNDHGIPENIRNAIRNSKICIIDNQIDDLKSLHDGLRTEGFSNLVKHKKSPPINQILSDRYDIIILDLNDVAQDITVDDGLGILKLLKEREPGLPILVVTGQSLSPSVQSIISMADLIRKKPVYASDLANDVDNILKLQRDKFWASLQLLKELNSIDIELTKELSLISRVRLHFSRKALEKKLVNKEEDIVVKLENVLKLIKQASSITSNISKLITNFVND